MTDTFKLHIVEYKGNLTIDADCPCGCGLRIGPISIASAETTKFPRAFLLAEVWRQIFHEFGSVTHFTKGTLR